MPAPNISQDTGYPDRCLLQMSVKSQATLGDSFIGFPESLQGNVGLESRSRQDRFLLNPFQLFILSLDRKYTPTAS